MPIAIGLLTFCLYLCTASGQLRSPDSEIQFRTMRALATFQGVAIDPIQQSFGTMTGLDGNEYSQYGLGVPLVGIPFHWLGMVLERVLPADANVIYRDFDRLVPGPWQDYVRERTGAALTNCGVNALLVVLVFLIARRVFGEVAGVTTALLYGACTINWPHSKELFGEPLAAVGWLLAFYFADRARREDAPRFPLLAGAGFGLALLARNDSLIALPGIAVCLLWPADAWREVLSLRTVRRAAWTALPVACVLAFLLAFNAYRFGDPLTTGYGDQAIDGENLAPRFQAWILPYGLFGQLLSPGKSLFLYSPILLMAVLAYPMFIRRSPALGVGTLTSVMTMLLAMSAYEQWPGGWCWGPRHIFQIMPLLVLPMGWYWTAEAGPWKPFRGYLFALLLAGAGLALYFGFTIGVLFAPLLGWYWSKGDTPWTRLRTYIIAGLLLAAVGAQLLGIAPIVTPLMGVALLVYWIRESGSVLLVRAYPIAALALLSVVVQILGVAASTIDAHRRFYQSPEVTNGFVPDTALVYDWRYSGPMLHAEMLTYEQYKFLDIAILRWLLMGGSPLRFGTLVVPLAALACGLWVWYLMRHPQSNGAPQP